MFDWNMSGSQGEGQFEESGSVYSNARSFLGDSNRTGITD